MSDFGSNLLSCACELQLLRMYAKKNVHSCQHHRIWLCWRHLNRYHYFICASGLLFRLCTRLTVAWVGWYPWKLIVHIIYHWVFQITARVIFEIFWNLQTVSICSWEESLAWQILSAEEMSDNSGDEIIVIAENVRNNTSQTDSVGNYGDRENRNRRAVLEDSSSDSEGTAVEDGVRFTYGYFTQD